VNPAGDEMETTELNQYVAQMVMDGSLKRDAIRIAALENGYQFAGGESVFDALWHGKKNSITTRDGYFREDLTGWSNS
jgi:hypothetical protein